MGKRIGTLLTMISVALGSMLITLYIFMIYNSFFDTAADAFTGFTVINFEAEPGVVKRTDLGSLREDLNSWAEKNGTILLIKGFSSPGIAVIDYEGWIKDNFHINYDGKEPKTVILQKNRKDIECFLDGDVLFPGAYNYSVVGRFDSRYSPTFQAESFFYYPLIDITDVNGLLFTDCKDEEAINDLRSLIEATGRSFEYQTFAENTINILEITVKMVKDGLLSQSMMFGLLGIVFCIAFSIHMMYRESNRYMEIHHLYGASYTRLYLTFLIKMLIATLAGILVGYGIAKNQLYIIHRSAYGSMLVMSLICCMVLTVILSSIGFIGWMRFNRNKEGVH